MPAIKRPRLWVTVAVCLVVFLWGCLHYNYHKVNSPRTAFQIEEQVISFQEEFEVSGVMIKVKQPNVKKVYSKEYDSYVYRYTIPFSATNITSDENQFQVENLQILSVGRAWCGWPEDSYQAKANQDTKWDKLKPNESTVGNWIIEVVEEKEFARVLYDSYALYYLQDEGQYLFKLKFV